MNTKILIISLLMFGAIVISGCISQGVPIHVKEVHQNYEEKTGCSIVSQEGLVYTTPYDRPCQILKPNKTYIVEFENVPWQKDMWINKVYEFKGGE